MHAVSSVGILYLFIGLINPHTQMLFQSKDEKYFIHNHLSFTVKYHKDDDSELSRIVGFEVHPYRFTFACSRKKINFAW
jgi:transmembrane 9 superfamily protein 2/4